MNSTKVAKVRNLTIGGNSPVRVQTMYDSSIVGVDPNPILEKISKLASMGCDLIRFSFVSKQDEPVFRQICKKSVLPIVADIHFDYKMALLALECGADKIRINPGNIGAKWKTEEVVKCARDKGAAIRIGLNTGSLPRESEYTNPVDIMVNSALEYISDFEKWGFENTVVSLKSSDIEKTMEANRKFASLSDYPIHLGVTEAGSAIISSVRSTWALGNLLNEHIGDTIRVSINGSIEDEVLAGTEILRTLGLRKSGVRIVACPRCGRHTFDSHGFLERVQSRLLSIDKDITVAIMGCTVNGPGEARGADLAVTGFGRKIFLYRNGENFAQVESAEDAERILFDEIDKL